MSEVRDHYKRAGIEPGEENSWQVVSEQEWLVMDSLRNVESIIFDESNQYFYITNGEKYELGRHGFISKISTSGDMVERKWVEGLNRPTGMATRDSLLFVADVNALLIIRTETGEILNQFMEPIKQSGLNDVAVDEWGDVYVSASFTHSVYKLIDDQLEIWVRDEERLAWANGLLIDGDHLLVAGLQLCAVNRTTKQIKLIELTPPVNDFDGIAADSPGGYFITTVENSGLYYIDEHKNSHQLMGGQAYFGDLHWATDRKKLYIPRGVHERSEYFIAVYSLE